MKTLLQSRTVWLAIAQAVIGVITIFATAYPSVGALIVVKSCADIILRLITTTAISNVPTPEMPSPTV